MNTSSRILILMSTYQGEKYLAAQLDSIIKQDIKNWILLIRDDGSNDETLNIINHYTQIDSRIQQLTDSLGNVKPAHSFSILMEHALKRAEPFIFFADQDDVWLPNKLTLSIATLEKESDTLPSLVFSDLCVVDKNLEVIHSSYLLYENLNPKKILPLNTLLIHNYITGCTVGINRALLQFAYPVPQTAVMHDWWCALCAALTGKIIYINETPILYRQHGQNDLGSKGFYHKFKKWQHIKKSLLPRIDQAKNLLQRVPKTNPYWNKVANFCSLSHSNLFSKIKTLYHLNLEADGFIRKWGFLFLLICLKKQAHSHNNQTKSPENSTHSN